MAHADRDLWCPPHLAMGAAYGLDEEVARVLMVPEVLLDSRFQAMCGVTERQPISSMPRLAIDANLARATPLCCWIGDDQVDRLWSEVRARRDRPHEAMVCRRQPVARCFGELHEECRPR